MRSIYIALGVFALSACSGSGSAKTGDTTVASSGASAQTTASGVTAPAFDADSAFALLKRQVAFGPRVPGTPGHEAQLAWMQEYLRARADSVIIQRIQHKGDKGQNIPMANVFARFNPGAAKRILLITHWDTRPAADKDPSPANRTKPIPGANDGASGVGVLMILADMMKKQPPSIGVDLLFTDGEDWEQGDMYIGAKHFAATMPEGYKPLYGILIDMIGDQNPIFPVEQTSQDSAPEVVDRVYRAAEQLGLANFFPRRIGGGVQDDHDPLIAAGIHTIDIIDGEYGAPLNNTFGEYWHTLNDTVEHTAPTGLGAVGKVLAYLIYNGG